MSPPLVPLRAKLDEGAPALGLWNTFPGTALVRMLAATSGVSWIMIDAEHGRLNDEHLYEHANAVASQGPSPVVRVPVGDAWWIKRALDAGAHGVLVPLVHDAAAARAAVTAARYAPAGARGLGPLFTHHAFGCTPAEYMALAAPLLVVLVQIESAEGLGNVDEIAQVDGLDVLFIGPFDLALSLGVPAWSPPHEEAIAAILAAAHRHHKKAAIFCSDGAQANARVAQGFDMASVGADMDVLAAGCDARVRAAMSADASADGASQEGDRDRGTY